VLKILFALVAGAASYFIAFEGFSAFTSARYWGTPAETLQLYAAGVGLLVFVIALNMLTYVHLRIQQHINGFILLILLSSGGFAAWSQLAPLLRSYIAP